VRTVVGSEAREIVIYNKQYELYYV
jgi:hypothetical protein